LPSLQPGQATRIFTGAPVPANADTVVMQEKTRVEGDRLIIEDVSLVKGNNVRPKGSDIRLGELALPKGTLLSPSAIGFLAAMGIEKVNVISHPRVTILITGKEIRQPGQPRNQGEIYDANSFMLIAALGAVGIGNPEIVFVDDELSLVHKALENAVAKSDIVLLTGGISVGDFDFVLEATQLLGIQKLFHKVKQKPGKPLFFGKKENVLVFGLPGNPSSVLSCFYEYVLIAIAQLTGRDGLLKKIRLPLGQGFSKKPGLTHFLKGRVSDGKAYPLDGQESYRLSSFARADCLIYLEEDGSRYEEGTLVEVHLLTI